MQHLLGHKVTEVEAGVSGSHNSDIDANGSSLSSNTVKDSDTSKTDDWTSGVGGDSTENKEGDNDKCDTIEDSDSDSEQIADQNIAAYERYRSICGTVEKYLEAKDDLYFKPFLIPEKFFRRFWVMDIVTKSHHNCCCFTKRYFIYACYIFRFCFTI